MTNHQKHGWKRLALALMLVLAVMLLSSCYTDPDRAFENGDDLNLSPTFQTVITNTPAVTNTPEPTQAAVATPVVTNTPEPTPTPAQSDWGEWTWDTSNTTNAPVNVVTSAPSSSGVISGNNNTGSVDIGNGSSNVGQAIIQVTIPPSGGNQSPSVPGTNSGSGNSSSSGSSSSGNSSSSGGSSSGSSSGSSGSNSSSSGSSSSGSSSSSSSSSGSSSSSSSSSSDSTLRPGSKGEAVKRLQNRLKELKYYTGSVDGDYGTGTTNAVKAFQQNNNLKADGIAGPKTLEAIYSYYAVSANTTGSGSGNGGKPSSGSSSSGSSSSGSSSSSNNNNKPNSSGSSSSSSSGSSSSSSNANAYTNGDTDTYLKLGSTGAQVKIMQNRLIVLGYLTGTANGKFETTTEEAVKAFQKRHNMYADGIAGPDTLTKLYSSSARKADSVVANLGSLKEGSQGGAVRALQKNLRKLGYYNGSVDGDYGPGTVAAVTAFQAANGLTADGIAGNGTQNAILIALNGGSTSGSSGAGSGDGSGSGNNGSTSPVTYGSTATSNGYSTVSATNGNSANVTAVQSALSAKGYYSGSLDGKYGSGTQKAVESFQRAQGLRVTGMAGPTTQRLLYGGTAADGKYSKLERGDSGSKVKTLQYALYEMKYYDGDITGKYDEATEAAVMLFQDCNNLEIDGVAGQMTQQLLYSSNAKPCTK